MREGRGAGGRRYWFRPSEERGGPDVYMWNPPGQDGEGSRALGRFFIGYSGTWYELVGIKAPTGMWPSIHYAYEHTEEAKRRQAQELARLRTYVDETADTEPLETKEL